MKLCSNSKADKLLLGTGCYTHRSKVNLKQEESFSSLSLGTQYNEIKKNQIKFLLTWPYHFPNMIYSLFNSVSQS